MKDKDKTLLIDGCDRAILGWFQRCGQPVVAVYDHERLVHEFVRQGMTEEEAVEWVSFNIVGGWLGQGTPAVLHRGDVHDIRREAE